MPNLPDHPLQHIPLFSGISTAALEKISAAAKKRRLEEGGFFFHQGDPADLIYVLAEGRVKLTQLNPDGQQVLLRIIAPYTLFGAIALTRGEAYPVSAQACEPSVSLYWTKEVLMALVMEIPQLGMNAINMMAEHVHEFQERLRQLATERVERRLARSLLRLASQFGKKIPEGVLIDMPLTRQDLAEMNGTTLYTVSRTLSQWQAQGIVELGRERVVIRYPHGLVRIAEDLA